MRYPRLQILEELPAGATGAEIGVHEGKFSEALLKRDPALLWLVDPWQHMPEYVSSLYGGGRIDQSTMDARYEAVLARFAPQIASGQVRVLRQLSVDAARAVPDGSLDYVYIDGNHAHEFVAADLVAWQPKVKPGGLIIGDDYSVVGWWGDGVVRAFHEFLTERRLLIHIKIGRQIALLNQAY